MKKQYLYLIIIVTFALRISQAAPVCWEVSEGGNGHMYEVITDPSMTWILAQQEAENFGGYLATINSDSEQLFIENLLESSSTQTGGYWIGLAETDVEGIYEWVTGEPLDYTNWCDGEPNNWNSNESRAHILWTNSSSESFYSRRGTWNDAAESGYGGFYPPDVARAGYIIEIVPEPVQYSDFLYTVTDDFIVNVYHNGVLVPLQQRTLLNEIYGATVEKIDLQSWEGDWIVFNVASNILRWSGSYYFAVAGMLEDNTMPFSTSLSSGQWSCCDDPSLANEFISDPTFMTSSKAKTIFVPWGDGDGLINSYAPYWSSPDQSSVWGDYSSRNLWIKVALSDSYVNPVTKVNDPVISTNSTVIPDGSLNVQIFCTTDSATIRYTTDGSDPSSTHGFAYRGSFYISNKMTIKAIAYKSGMEDSQVVSATFLKENSLANIKANFLYTVSDDFIVNVYHNGVLVPLGRRNLLNEVYGATVEQIYLQIREDDWIVFNVANNILRWNGSYYFAVAGMLDGATMDFTTKFPASQWSYCDDPSKAKEFIQNKNFMLTNIVKRVENPWGDGKALMQSCVSGWSGDPIWGDPDKRNVWIKFNASSLIPGDANFDGLVDVGDLGILAANYGIEFDATWVMGDFNGDEDVDCGDLGIIAANYGYGTSGNSDYKADAKAMGLTAEETNEEVESNGLMCPLTGLPLIAGLFLISLFFSGNLKCKNC